MEYIIITDRHDVIENNVERVVKQQNKNKKKKRQTCLLDVSIACKHSHLFPHAMEQLAFLIP